MAPNDGAHAQSPPPCTNRDRPYVFACYAHVDDEVVYADIGYLQSAGIPVWYDDGIQAGSVWREEIGEAIQQCDLMVVFASVASLDSPHCRREIDFALERERPIVVVHLDETPLSPGLTMSLGRQQALFRNQPDTDRYRQQLLDAAQRQLNGSGSDASAARSVSGTSKNRARTRVGRISVAVAATFCLLAVGAGWWFLQKNGAVPSVAEVTEIRAVGVLPLRVGESVPPHIGRVLAEELMSSLHELGTLKIASPVDAFRLAGSSLSVRELGAALRVDALVTGSVDLLDGRLRTTVTVTRVADGAELDAASFGGDLDNLLHHQRQVTTRMRRAFGPEPEQDDGFADFGTDNPEAYRLGMRGIQLSREVGNLEALAEAELLLRAALALDERYFVLYDRLMAVLLTKSVTSQHADSD